MVHPKRHSVYQHPGKVTWFSVAAGLNRPNMGSLFRNEAAPMTYLKNLLFTLSLMLATSVSSASTVPDVGRLAPWPTVDGNYLQLFQNAASDWFLVSAVVKGDRIYMATGRVEVPTDPSSLLMQLVPLASIHVRGTDCESLEYKHLVTGTGPYMESYWMAIPRGIDMPKPACQIKNSPEKWQFVART
ncbi:hypothetical protein D3C85_1096590 [compost metagenome]